RPVAVDEVAAVVAPRVQAAFDGMLTGSRIASACSATPPARPAGPDHPTSPHPTAGGEPRLPSAPDRTTDLQ
ncbi:MAG: hypothetical protein V4755_08965, partial [Curtobacterium sp.]